MVHGFVADEWNFHRRLIQPTFHINTLEAFLGTFVDASNVLVQRFKDAPNQLNITHLVNQCVINILNGKFNKGIMICGIDAWIYINHILEFL